MPKRRGWDLEYLAPYVVSHGLHAVIRVSRCFVSYGDWNEKLVEHVFGRYTDSGPVSRIPATPEELCVAAGKDPATLASAEIDAITADFLECIKTELATPRRSLLRYCLYYREDPTWWSPGSYQQPYFFAMLWLTCLIAYGFPVDVEGDFYTRIRAALGGNVNLQSNALGGLDDVWEDLEKWTSGRPDCRELVLPQRSNHRSIIGRSHFLAYPHRFDRARLASVLQAAGLAGHEPSVRLALEALRTERDRFSAEFRDDLDAFFADYIDQGRDPKSSPFWRAVRQVARELPTREDLEKRTGGHVSLLAEWDQDELLVPFLAFSRDWVPPADWEVEDLDFQIGDICRRALLDEAIIEKFLLAPLEFMSTAEARPIQEGVVPLLEEMSGVFRLAVAEEIASCQMALVKTGLAAALRREFGGREEECGVRGWTLVTNARLEQRDRLDGALSSVRSLLQTTDAPRPAMVGGSRVSGNSFYALKGYLPDVRARQARAVSVRMPDGQAVPCINVLTDVDRWRLPDSIVERVAVEAYVENEYEVTASYDVTLMGSTITRVARTTFRLQRPVLATMYKGIPSGSYRLETCAQYGETISGPRPSLGLGFTGDEFDAALDVLPFDSTARWLGPGLGQMSLEPRPGFPWLAIGPKNQPEYLVLQGDDPNVAPIPSRGCSSFGGDRRHWARAFAKGVPTWWKRGSVYIHQNDWPAPARELLNRYRTRLHDKRHDTVPVTETHLDSHLNESPWGLPSSSSALHDIFAALFQNRAGIPLREVHEHIGRVLDLQDAHSLREQLVRSLIESGALDSLRRSDGRQTIVTARRPRLISYRRGPRWMGVLIGLVPSPVRNELRAAVDRLHDAGVEHLRTSNEHLPGTMRVTVTERRHLHELSTDLGFATPEYVEWPAEEALPDVLRIDGDLRHDPVPDLYVADATWCWDTGMFRRTTDAVSEIVVERRRDGYRVPIYVVLRGSAILGWSYYRTWALLAAYGAAERPFLREEISGVFVVAGDSPLHLPLPLARLCAIMGLGIPGPRVKTSDPFTVEAYCYPFGSHLLRLLLPFLPPEWLSRRKL